MTESLNAVEASKSIAEGYIRYLKTAFVLRSDALRQQFWDQLGERGRTVKGPLLESTQPFQQGASIRDLVEAGVLNPAFARLPSEAFPLDRPLYWHQEAGIRKLTEDHRNIVVATGTGSGKTETYLLPILNHLLDEGDRGTLEQPGVRALLLYPLNALANDQLKRLRLLLNAFPQITFGRYVGETPTDRQRAEDAFSVQFPGQPRVPNELLSRSDMQDRPPHILLTNYAMLEYLLLRPKDAPFFDGATARHWRFLVLDEAHSYDGAAGTETAYLIRRLRDRLVASETGRLHCVATSATIGAEKSSYERICNFATNLFGEEFEWDPSDETRQDVVTARRQPLDSETDCWGRGNSDLYDKALDLRPAAETGLEAFLRSGQETVVPGQFRDPWRDALSAAASRSVDGHNAWRLFAATLLAGDERLHELRRSLQSPRLLSEVASEVAADAPDPEATVSSLVSLASAARTHDSSNSLLNARYHLFFRALEGAFVCPAEHSSTRGRLLRLTRHRACPECEEHGLRRRMYELATCDTCGAEYLVGRRAETDTGAILDQVEVVDPDSDDREYFLIAGAAATFSGESLDQDEDEEASTVTAESHEGSATYRMCPECGRLEPGTVDPSCGCHAPSLILQHAVPPTAQSSIRCVVCGARGNRRTRPAVTPFLTGRDAPVSVLASLLYWGLPASSDERFADLPGEGRKLLSFADSRQDAAFFASYVERTYGKMLRRRLIRLALSRLGSEDEVRLQDLVTPVERLLRKAHLVREPMSRRQGQAEAWRVVMEEFLSVARRQSLEGSGLLGIRLIRPRGWVAPTALMRAWQLDSDEAWALIEVLIGTLRSRAVVTFPEEVQPTDEAFAPRNRLLYVREQGTSSQSGILSWLSDPGRNSRHDYLKRLGRRLGLESDSAKVNSLVADTLRQIWLVITKPQWRNHLVQSSLPRIGVVYQVGHEVWEVFSPDESGKPVYRCSICGRTTSTNVRGVCPSFRCEGELRALDPRDPTVENDSYRNAYLQSPPIALVAEEHTAQWRSDAAATIQQQFMDGEVNLLSCSTTFELGVDVGDLQAVLLRNVPPSPANYIQRAGRAGRRTDSTALVVTFAQRRSHDLTFFSSPERMVAGVVSPPNVVLENEKIARRHVASVALAAFLRQEAVSSRVYPNVGSFFEGEHSGARRFISYLADRPNDVRDALDRLLPKSVAQSIGVQAWQWGEDLCGNEHGPLPLAVDEVTGDLATFTDLAGEAYAQHRGIEGDRFLRVAQTIRARETLGFLASRNVLPKYGFPVDLVELKTEHINSDSARRLELTRDLRIAIAEYAPGSEVVAGKAIWTGGGLYLPPGRQWPAYNYVVCSSCGRFRRSQRKITEQCPGCGASVGTARPSGQFLIPEFGFVASADTRSEPGESRPNRGYASRVYFAEYGDTARDQDDEDLVFEYLGRRIEVLRSRQGKLVVVNSGPKARGFVVCERCGYATPATSRIPGSHSSPQTARRCSGSLIYRHLGHEFLTDVVEIRFFGQQIDSAASDRLWLSLVYALLEGASSGLSIRRGDIDGCLYPYAQGMAPAVILFDTVPGGAGHSFRIGEQLPRVLDSALERVSRCGCGPETSCYECLRSYGNQPYHDILTRGSVRDFLSGESGARA